MPTEYSAIPRKSSCLSTTALVVTGRIMALVMPVKIHTSQSSPLRIARVRTHHGGEIGMTLCPGKCGPGRHAWWDRCLRTDLQAIRQWDAQELLTLMEDHELHSYGVAGLGEAAREVLGEPHWHALPIIDQCAPGPAFERGWQQIAPRLHARLSAGERIAVHCLGGLGRTGVVACRLLVETGVAPAEALSRVRKARPGAVETHEQARHVLALQMSGRTV